MEIHTIIMTCFFFNIQDEGIDSDFQDDGGDDGNESDNPDGMSLKFCFTNDCFYFHKSVSSSLPSRHTTLERR